MKGSVCDMKGKETDVHAEGQASGVCAERRSDTKREEAERRVCRRDIQEGEERRADHVRVHKHID